MSAIWPNSKWCHHPATGSVLAIDPEIYCEGYSRQIK